MTPLLRRLGHGIESVREGVLDLVFTPRCVECGEEGAYMCPTCLAAVEPEPSAFEIGAGAAAIEAHAVYRFEGAARKAVHQLKYQGVTALAPPLGRLMAARLPQRSASMVVAPIPLHRSRLRERGYNQAELLAKEVGRRTGALVTTRLLSRTQATPPQAQARSVDARLVAVRGAFQAAPEAAGADVLLIDDVCTTGSTLAACADALLRAGAARVAALTFAREPGPRA